MSLKAAFRNPGILLALAVLYLGVVLQVVMPHKSQEVAVKEADPSQVMTDRLRAIEDARRQGKSTYSYTTQYIPTLQ